MIFQTDEKRFLLIFSQRSTRWTKIKFSIKNIFLIEKDQQSAKKN